MRPEEIKLGLNVIGNDTFGWRGTKATIIEYPHYSGPDYFKIKLNSDHPSFRIGSVIVSRISYWDLDSSFVITTNTDSKKPCEVCGCYKEEKESCWYCKKENVVNSK